MPALRIALRLAVLLLLGASAVSLAALGGEYPGETAAGRRVAFREVLPLAVLAWVHLAVLDATPGRSPFVTLAAFALVGDVVLLARGVAHTRTSAPPLTLALPVIAALLLIGTAGVVWCGRRRT